MAIFGAAKSQSADSAIRLLFGLIDEKERLQASNKSGRLVDTSPHPVVVCIARAVTGQKWQLYGHTSADLWDRYANYMSNMADMPLRRKDWAWELAVLCLYHPRNPCPDALLAILKSNPSIGRLSGPSGASTAAEIDVASMLRRIMELLRERGQIQEQQWVDENCKEMLYGVLKYAMQPQQSTFAEGRDQTLSWRGKKPSAEERQQLHRSLSFTSRP